MSDADIAAKLGVRPLTVTKARRARGIAATRHLAKAQSIDWEKQPLGQQTDAELGRRLGVSAALVRKRRIMLGIAAFEGTPPDAPPATSKGKLGSIDDALLAWRQGVRGATVARARRASGRTTAAAQECPYCAASLRWQESAPGKAPVLGRGRPARRKATPTPQVATAPRSEPKHKALARAPYGRATDESIALAAGVSTKTVQSRRRKRGIAARGPHAHVRAIDWDAQPLGSVRDGELAQQLGVSLLYVRKMRQERGIAAPATSSARKGIDWDTQPLGEVPDGELARALGVTPSAVSSARVRRGIPSLHGDRRKGVRWDEEPLGAVPDALLAWKHEVTLATVTKMRKARRRPDPGNLECPVCGRVLGLSVQGGRLELTRGVGQRLTLGRPRSR